jgi:hypothetical protein
MKVGLLKVPTWQEWVADISADGKVIGVDPNVFTVGKPPPPPPPFLFFCFLLYGMVLEGLILIFR